MKRLMFSMMTIALSGSAMAAGANYDAIHAASIRGDTSAVESACKEIDASGDAAYQAAYCQYRIAYAAMNRAADEGMKSQAQQALERATKLLQNNTGVQGEKRAETLALLSLTYGLQIALDGSRGFDLGRKAWAAAGTAEKIAPANPRVLLAKAGNLMYTPALFGGDTQKAAKTLEEAVNAYPSRPAADNWGLDDAHIDLALVKLRARQYDAARSELQQVLALNPDHAWAKHLLSTLP